MYQCIKLENMAVNAIASLLRVCISPMGKGLTTLKKELSEKEVYMN